MNVAPSFKDYTFVGEPFDKGGKQYIHARNPVTGSERDIRVYSDKEYARQYGKVQEPKWLPGGLKYARGFKKGYVTVIRGNRDEDEEWLRASCARWAGGMRWHIASTDEIPEDAPKHFKYIRVTWDECGGGDDYHVKSPEEIKKVIDRKIKNGEWYIP